MILVTVGTDGPFDRLIRIVDDWACRNNRSDIFAQIGDGGTRRSSLLTNIFSSQRSSIFDSRNPI